VSWSEIALPLVLAVPLAGCLLLAGLPRLSDRAAAAVGTSVAAVVLGLLLAVAAGFDYGRSREVQFAFDRRWIPAIGVRFHVGVDGISLPLLVLTALLVLLCCAYSLGHVPPPGRVRALIALMLLLEVGVLGTFASLDLLLFFVAFEVVLVPMYFLIAVWGGAPP
jgi:NADH-quinone oxidoreductase subunit M